MTDDVIHAMIVEDDSKSRQMLASQLLNMPGIRVLAAFGTAEEAFPEILSQLPELLFLDVELPGKSGIELLEQLRMMKIDLSVIFTTAYDHYAISAIKQAAFDYLLKPVNKEELLTAITRFRMNRKQGKFEQKVDFLLSQISPLKKIKFNTRRGFMMIDPDDIIYCQADWNYTELWLGKDRKELVTMNIGKVEELLPPDHFCRAGRSLIINTNYISKVNRITRKCSLIKGPDQFELGIPLLHIRRLERVMEKRTTL
jgi:two-component system, LytTR family, response regulator